MEQLAFELKSESIPLDPALRARLIKDYAPLVSFIAYRLAAKLPACVDINDLISSGFVGLIEAIDRYDPEKDSKFRTFGEWRIRGAMLDELRYLDFVPRSVRDKLKYQSKVHKDLQQKLGRHATAAEIAAEMGISVQDYHKLANDTAPLVQVSMTYSHEDNSCNEIEPVDPRTAEGVDTDLVRMENRKLLRKVIASLPKQQAVVLRLYFFQELTLKQCAIRLGLTESRVSQIRTAALRNLKKKLQILGFHECLAE